MDVEPKQLADVKRLYEWRNEYGQTFMTRDRPSPEDRCASVVRVWVPLSEEKEEQA
jgi:hypothetical protein